MIAHASRRNIAANAGTMRPATASRANDDHPRSLSSFGHLQFLLQPSLTKRLAIFPDFHFDSQPTPVASRLRAGLRTEPNLGGSWMATIATYVAGVDAQGGFSNTEKSPRSRYSYSNSPPTSFHETGRWRQPARRRDSSKHGSHALHSSSYHKVRHFLTVTMPSGVRRLYLARGPKKQ